ncbi:thylakoid lumenal 16.5 kDa protein, chloroplastic [Salvia miltiorrhiza]|uniref:thylakoid lumenal 16.5 kDa protein, chloroplastic n=1 Tax=Salvia miltiorrhiza TaxID=226208 RepID=UPI0025ABC540|nr:thylakoid lumenal 16.5 kDa protein, chloroplastic [Salvia miltiorrhiza]
MATFLLSNAKLFLPLPSTCSPSTSHTQIVCRSASIDPSSIVTTRRSIALSLAGAATFLSANAGAAILEADEDDELMEKVKKDRKKRIEKQGVISSSTQEKAYLQDVVYKLSKIGQAIEKKDLAEANSVIGSTKDTQWLQKVNSALNKLSSSEEEKTAVDLFNLSMATLISSISENDEEASKIAFVASATAFEKWTSLSGLAGQLKGL